MNIVIMVEPSQSEGLATAVRPRQFDAVDEFARALSDAGVAEVSVIEATVEAAPPHGYLIVFGSRGLDRHPELGRRTVVINADRSDALEMLERTAALAAVEKQRYFRWRTARENEAGKGLFARKALLSQFHAVLLPGPFHSEHYALCGAPGCMDLPSLLVAYLQAHERTESTTSSATQE